MMSTPDRPGARARAAPWKQPLALEILPSEEVRADAMRLLRVHALTAADALQLAAAAVLAGGGRSEVAVVTFDERLALAARLEGFEALPAP